MGETLLRRGLPRVEGGDPWPSAGTVARLSEGYAAPSDSPPAAGECRTEQVAVRRGLPRITGGEGWPPAGTRAAILVPVPVPAEEAAAPEPVVGVGAPRDPAPAATPEAPAPATERSRPVRTSRHGASADRGRRPSARRVLVWVAIAVALGIAAGAAVALARTLIGLPSVAAFLDRYPGEYETGAAPGFPAWVNWQHFFNVFLMVLIIRSGLRVRSEKRPEMFWTPRRGGSKISLTLWFHQFLDIFWLVNGIVFVVLLFSTGHWMRIVPTSWEVFPNALSAALQYVSLDWPTEHGWANYNSLQQLAYFTTVFIAAPLAAITGVRMSGLWPRRAERLSRAYPVEWARAVHFPVMLYFVAFIVVHVLLVVTTGFLRNLNHMYATQDAVTWTGFWVFLGSLIVIVGAWFAARPVLLAPIARVFGAVSSR